MAKQAQKGGSFRRCASWGFVPVLGGLIFLGTYLTNNSSLGWPSISRSVDIAPPRKVNPGLSSAPSVPSQRLGSISSPSAQQQPQRIDSPPAAPAAPIAQQPAFTSPAAAPVQVPPAQPVTLEPTTTQVMATGGYFMAKGASNCEEGQMVDSEEECTKAVEALGRVFSGNSENGARPAGCYWEGQVDSYFNAIFETAEQHDFAGGICKAGGSRRTTTASPPMARAQAPGQAPAEVETGLPPVSGGGLGLGLRPQRGAPEGVRLPPGWNSPWDGPGEGQEDPAGTTFGFYLTIFNLVPPVLRVVGSVRRYYPDSPIYLLSDGGSVDLSQVCRLPKYNCTCEMAPGENSRWNPHSWFLRFHRIAKALGTTYIIYLEPDVLVRGRHRFHPPYDAGGIYDNFNPGLHEETLAYMQQRGREANPCFKVRWSHFGLAGGSYLRTAAVLDAFHPANVARIDFKGLHRHEGERLFSSDLAMHLALSMRGYTVYPWRESAQSWKNEKLETPEQQAAFAAKWPAYNPAAAFEHNHKEHYHEAIPQEEQALLRMQPSKPNLVCHGCVWFRGPALEERLPVASPGSYEIQNVQPSHQPEDLCTLVGLGGEKRHPEGPLAGDFCRGGEGQSLPPPATGTGTGTGVGIVAGAGAAGTPGAGSPGSPGSPGTPTSETASSTPSTAKGATSQGLPIAPGPRPAWLVHEDSLIIDARPQAYGGILVAHTVLIDGRQEWGSQSKRPAWLKAILAANRAHLRRHGHAMLVRWMPTLRFPCPWQDKECDSKTPQRERENCWLNMERENFNWEKHQLMLDYLRSPQNFSHVLMLDADAALVHPTRDTLTTLAAQLDEQHRDLFFTNEDWIGDVSSLKRINGGFIFAKNTAFTRQLFEDMLDAHWYGPHSRHKSQIFKSVIGGCNSNEQLCLGSIQGREEFASKMILASGKNYNCGPTDATVQRMRDGDPVLEVMHFMGGGKGAAARAICQGAKFELLPEDRAYGCERLL